MHTDALAALALKLMFLQLKRTLRATTVDEIHVGRLNS